MSVSVVVGNPKPLSRTRDAAVGVAEALSGRAPDTVIDLADLGADLLDRSSTSVAAAVDVVRSSDLLIVASPTYKATYTGLLKLFLERFGAGELESVTGVPVMLGGDLRHALAVETHLRPLLVEIGLVVPVRGLFLVDSDGLDSDTFRGWVDSARRQVALTAGSLR